MGRLDELDLTLSVGKKEYNKELEELSLGLMAYQRKLRKSKASVICVFEGVDAGGKGGAIKRLTWYLDPRGFYVHPIGPPTPDELARNYLWRFWDRLPARGRMAIFDRSWYGRVLVEGIEGFATKEEWLRAYEEINTFERTLADDYTILCKFWIQIDKDEQLKRFEERKANPFKQWKLTEDDWRNRDKWKDYQASAEDMFAKTHTAWAPWTLVEGNCKRWARLKVIKTVLETKDRL